MRLRPPAVGGLAALCACVLSACSSPQYDVRRFSAQGSHWKHCRPGADGEERPAIGCPEAPVLLAGGGGIQHTEGETVSAKLRTDAVTAGPMVLVTEGLTYRQPAPEAPAPTPLPADETVRSTAPTRKQLFGSVLINSRRRTLHLPGVPLQATVHLPKGKPGRERAWTVMGFPGGRSSMQVELTPQSIPAGARLALSFAVGEGGRRPNSPAVRFRVESTTGERVWEERIQPVATGETWHDAVVDLASHAGKTMSLRLIAEAEGDGAFSYPVWGQPALLLQRERTAVARPNVLLISLDTLRGDFLSLAGHPTPTSPVLDELAKEGVAFLNAFSTFPSTGGSHMSMMTSLHPCAHLITVPKQTVGLSPAATTVAEAFAAAGWRTAAVTEDGFIRGEVGFSRGFDRYVDQEVNPPRALGIFANGINRALNWIAEDGEQPFFFFFHTYQPHEKYKVPPHLRPLFPVPSNATPLEQMRIDYEGGIRYTDELLGGFLRTLRERGVLDRTLIVITSDHGEAFGEHGLQGHGSDVFDEQLHVPLIFHHPTLATGGRRIDRPVSLIDLAPTMLDAVGIDRPKSFEGRSLMPWVRGERAPRKPSRIFGEQTWGLRQTMYRSPFRVWISDENGFGVFDPRTDPQLQRPRVPVPSVDNIGVQAITRFRNACDLHRRLLERAAQSPTITLDPARQDALRALGYLQ